ncbi:hypothetical protein QAD02_016292 [Eretmocerus hayati]|uniref:Uncharacterized protein n=1 Tax=Eretmocerus hayati TaxID=131215 RepID=A0ACC2PFG5_9HYME|nr:hypothetical protein QAD02_016292 [Eretmocerus hayati]
MKTLKDRRPQKDYRKHFELYKGLRSEHGHILWTLDYDFLNQNQPDYFEQWNILAPLVIEYAQERGKFCPTFPAVIEAGKGYIVALLCLSRLFTTVNRKRTADGVPLFGFTIDDNVKAFILRCGSVQEFIDFKDLRNLHSIETRRPVGPFITFIGDLGNDGTIVPQIQQVENDPDAVLDDAVDDPEVFPDDVQVVVTINGFDFKIDSNRLFDAIVYCYKAFSILSIPFPVESARVWTFLYHTLFKDELKNPKTYNNVGECIDIINAKLRAVSS